MAVTTYSPEGRMQTRLHQLGCSQLSFSKIVSGMIGKSRIAEAFQDPTKCFDNDIGERLLTKIAEMESLAQEIAPIPIDWTKADKVAAALVIRSVAKIDENLATQGSTGLLMTRPRRLLNRRSVRCCWRRNRRNQMETKELPQSMFDDAVQEIVTTRTENGFLTPDKELNAAVRVHIKMQLSKTMLDMFYRGELRFTEENGEDLVCNTTPEETRKRCAISKKPVEAAFLWGAYNDPGPKTAARITFKCSGCGKRQTVHHTQLGNIPLPLKVKCKLGHETLVIPYHWDGRPEIGGHNVEN